jgi:hypothetical protein
MKNWASRLKTLKRELDGLGLDDAPDERAPVEVIDLLPLSTRIEMVKALSQRKAKLGPRGSNDHDEPRLFPDLDLAPIHRRIAEELHELLPALIEPIDRRRAELGLTNPLHILPNVKALEWPEHIRQVLENWERSAEEAERLPNGFKELPRRR